MTRSTWVIAAALVAACGRGPAVSSAAASGGDGKGGSDAPAPPLPGAEPCNGLITVSLAGTEPAGDQQLDLVASVHLSGSGGAIQPELVTTETLSFPSSEPYRIAVAPVPEGGGAVDVTIRLDGVHVTGGGRCTSVDACSAPISFRVETGRISPERCQVVAILDLAHSIAAGPSGPVFLPHFRVRY